MLKNIYKFTIRAGTIKRVPPVVVILEHPEWISILCVPDSDGPVARGGRQEIPCQCNCIDSGPVALENEMGHCVWEEVRADGFVFEVAVRSRTATPQSIYLPFEHETRRFSSNLTARTLSVWS